MKIIDKAMEYLCSIPDDDGDVIRFVQLNNSGMPTFDLRGNTEAAVKAMQDPDDRQCVIDLFGTGVGVANMGDVTLPSGLEVYIYPEISHE